MDKKPTYEDLEQKIRDLEQRAVESKWLAIALQESESKYRLLVENAADIIYRTNDRGHFIFLNPAAMRSTGYQQMDLIGRHFSDIVRPDFQQRVIRFYDHQLLKKIPLSYFELPLQTRDKKDIWIGQHVQLIIIDGKITGLQAIARDITARKQMEEDLLNSEQKFSATFHINPNPMMISDLATGAIIDANQSFTQWTGYLPDEVIGATTFQLHLWVNPEDREIITRTLLAAGEVNGLEILMRQRSGNERNVLCSARLIEIKGGRYLLTLVNDVTERKQMEKALAKSEEILKATQKLAKVGGWEWDVVTKTATWTDETYRIHDIAPDQLAARGAEHIPLSLACYSPDDRHFLEAAFQRCASYGIPYNLEFPFTTSRGRNIWVRTTAEAVMADGKVVRVTGTIMDITERKRAEEEIRHLATHDVLTNLPSLRLARDRLAVALILARRNNNLTGVMFIDLDGFKNVNDTLGHDGGDHVLKQVAKRLLSCVRESDTVARVGGDEFLLIAPEIHAAHNAAQIAEKIIQRISRPVHFKGQQVNVGASIGIALYPDHGKNMDQLIKQADDAMYKIKRAGKNGFCFPETLIVN